MAHWVHVTINGADGVNGPSGTKNEAEQQLSVIRGVLGRRVAPDLPWLAVMGRDIVSARIIDDENL